MRHFPSEKALVTAYWRKLARSNQTALRGPRARLGRNTALRRSVGVARRRYQLTRQPQLQAS
jgi:hypothetical protein